MTAILIDSFIGEIPRNDPRLLPNNGAVIAKNCDLRSGKIVPDKTDITVFTGISPNTKTLYGRRMHDWGEDWGEGFTTNWITWDLLTYYFESPFAREQLNRLYTLQYEAEDIYHPMQYEGTGIPLQDLKFLAPTKTISAVYIDRNDALQNASTIIAKGADETVSEEISGETLTASIDSIICVGSANPAGSTINGDVVTFDYFVQKYHSTDGSSTWILDTTENGSYDGKVLYAGGTDLFINPAITASHTYSGATNIKIAVSASGKTITMNATGMAMPPTGEILDRYYLFTYVYKHGEEGPPSEISNLATIYKGDVAELSNIGDVTLPHPDIVKKRIYTTSGGVFKVVGEINASETTFIDDVATTGLYGELMTANNPQDMHGMVISPLGFVIGWNGRDILFCNEYLPYAWDETKTITVKYNIVGMVPVNDITYILTEGAPYILSGFTIDSMSLEEIPESQSTISKTGMVKYKSSAFYISPDGIVQLKGGSSDLFTRALFGKDIWRTLHPESGTLTVHDDVLHFTTNNSHYRFSLAEEMVLTQGEVIGNVTYQDLRRDSMFYTKDTTIEQYLGGSGTKTAIWKSKVFDFKSDTVMSVGRVIADAYTNVIFNVYADDVLVSTTTVTDNKPFRLLGTKRSKSWSMEVLSNDIVSSIEIAQSMKELT